MAFDEISLPLRVSYGARGGPQFMTEIVTIRGGYERRNQNWSQARRRFDARTGVASAGDASVLLSFFQARAGRARGFRLKDWSDNTSRDDGVSAPSCLDQIIGVGDAVQSQFQLVKKYGDVNVSYSRDIRKPVEGSIKVSVDDVEYLTEWSVDTMTGVVTFAQAPALGAVIKAGYSFDVPVRFDTDTLNLTATHPKLSDVNTEIPLMEVRV